MVDNVKIYAPLTRDANLKSIDSPVMPFPAGNKPILVTLLNEGFQDLTSVTIKWSVNGIQQTPYSWTGFLPLGAEQNNIAIGSYNFPAGLIKDFKVWVENPNGGSDQNRLNDTARATLAAALCGIYTIGGATPDYVNFSAAAFALNNAGIVCPVTFRVRNGSYNEQIKLYQILGSSSVNTITFEGENGDSSLAELHYKASNPSNDFTLSLTGTDYITFRKLGIRRTNGTGNLIIQSGSHDVTAENCRLGNVTSPNTSCDSVLTFRNNNMTGFDINLQHPDAGSRAGRITVEGNYLNSLYINNSRDVIVRDNRNRLDTSYYAVDFTIDRSSTVLVEGNRMRRLYMNRDTSLSVLSNNIYENTYDDNIRGVLINESRWGNVTGNTIRKYINGLPRGIEVIDSRSIVVANNHVSVRNYELCCGYWSMGVYLAGGSNRNVTVRGNTIFN
ncbi:MAG: hypothetical protein ACKOKF_07065, partial [Bacteroidota bacterium]